MVDYKEQLSQYLELKEQIFNPDRRTKDLTFSEGKDNTLVIERKGKVEVSIKLPKYINIDKRLSVLKKQKETKMNQYIVIRNRILFGDDKVMKDPAVKKELNEIKSEIFEIEEEISTLEGSRKDLLHKGIDSKIINLTSQIKDVDTQMKALLKKIRNDPSLDSSEISRLIRQYIELPKKTDLKKLHSDLKEVKDRPVLLMHKVKEGETNASVVPVQKKEVKVVPKKEKKEELVVEEKKPAPEKEALDTLAELPFKNFEQCITKKRGEKFFVTKDQLLKIIESKPELRDAMPKNYKKLSKEGLCEKLNIPLKK